MNAGREAVARRTARVVLVLALAGFGLLATLPGLLVWVRPFGTFGIVANAEGVVRDVDPQSSAAAAGIEPGDVLSGPLGVPVGEVWVGAPGVGTAVTVSHRGQLRHAILIAHATRLPPGDVVLYPLRKLIAALFIVTGALLVLLRPSLATWGFFLYCVGDNPYASSGVLFATLPPALYLVFVVLRDLLAAAGIVGLLIFALNFPRLDVAPWRRPMQGYLVAVLAVLSLVAIGGNLAAWLGHPLQWLLRLDLVLRDLAYVAIALVFVETFVRATPVERQRISWVIFAFAIGLFGLALAHAAGGFQPSLFNTAGLFERLCGLLIGGVPLAVAYAVIRHHVFDFSVAISHAAVYGAATALLVAFFAVLHSIAARTLAHSSAGLVVELAAAIAIGFSLEAVQRRLDQFIQLAFFRRHRAARAELAHAAARLRHGAALTTIDRTVVAAPVECLGVRSAALFRREANGWFARVAAIGWEMADLHQLAPGDALLKEFRTRQRQIDVRDRAWSADVPGDDARPLVAFPIFIRNELTAVALYGARNTGEQFDRQDIAVMDELMQAAAIGYDEHEVHRLRVQAAEAASLREQLEHLRTSATPKP